MNYKQVIIIRKDLKMGCGKMCGQTAHGSILSMIISNQDTVNKWINEGMRKIVLKTNSLEELQDLSKLLAKNNIKSTFVHDFGLTQVESGTATTLAVEVVDECLINEYISEFKLL